MWTSRMELREKPLEAAGRSPELRAALRLLALFFVFAALWTSLAAQSSREEFDLLRTYALPDTAVPMRDLEQAAELYLQGGQPFSGLAYERFDNGRLSRLVTLKDGQTHGPTYLWYPDGAPQMSANYRQGRLQGRFLGWYRHGGVIYDMVIARGGYAGDFIEDDGSRGQDEAADAEGEANERDLERD